MSCSSNERINGRVLQPLDLCCGKGQRVWTCVWKNWNYKSKFLKKLFAPIDDVWRKIIHTYQLYIFYSCIQNMYLLTKPCFLFKKSKKWEKTIFWLLIKLMIFFHHRRFLQEKEVIIEYSLIYLLFSIEKQILKKFDFHTWVYLKFRISHSFTIFDPFISLDRHKLKKKRIIY